MKLVSGAPERERAAPGITPSRSAACEMVEGLSAQLAVRTYLTTPRAHVDELYPTWKNSLARETVFLSAPRQTGLLSQDRGHLLSEQQHGWRGDGAGVLLAPWLPFPRDLRETRDARRPPGLARGLWAVLGFPAPCTCVGRMEGPHWACGAR